MSPRFIATAFVLALLCIPNTAAAQTMVTFELPVNLTNLDPSILKIGLYCQINSPAIVAPNAGQAGAVDEIDVVGGQVVTTLRVVVVLPQGSLQSPVGKTATWTCDLRHRTATGLGGFVASHPNPVNVLSPLPPPMQGSFVW
jgi:hypothetical protein